MSVGEQGEQGASVGERTERAEGSKRGKCISRRVHVLGKDEKMENSLNLLPQRMRVRLRPRMEEPGRVHAFLCDVFQYADYVFLFPAGTAHFVNSGKKHIFRQFAKFAQALEEHTKKGTEARKAEKC